MALGVTDNMPGFKIDISKAFDTLSNKKISLEFKKNVFVLCISTHKTRRFPTSEDTLCVGVQCTSVPPDFSGVHQGSINFTVSIEPKNAYLKVKFFDGLPMKVID
jgi:hypothetical protein